MGTSAERDAVWLTANFKTQRLRWRGFCELDRWMKSSEACKTIRTQVFFFLFVIHNLISLTAQLRFLLLGHCFKRYLNDIQTIKWRFVIQHNYRCQHHSVIKHQSLVAPFKMWDFRDQYSISLAVFSQYILLCQSLTNLKNLGRDLVSWHGSKISICEFLGSWEFAYSSLLIRLPSISLWKDLKVSCLPAQKKWFYSPTKHGFENTNNK